MEALKVQNSVYLFSIPGRGITHCLFPPPWLRQHYCRNQLLGAQRRLSPGIQECEQAECICSVCLCDDFTCWEPFISSSRRTKTIHFDFLVGLSALAWIDTRVRVNLNPVVGSHCNAFSALLPYVLCCHTNLQREKLQTGCLACKCNW